MTFKIILIHYIIGVIVTFGYLVYANWNKSILLILHIYLLISIILPYISIILDLYYRIKKVYKAINPFKDSNLD